MSTPLSFHERLRYERELKGWSQADLAERVGCDMKTVGRWENGDVLPRPYHRRMLSELFEKSVVDLGLALEAGGRQKEGVQWVSEGRVVAVGVQMNDQVRETTKVDWGAAPHVEHFYGRRWEQEEVRGWLEGRSCALGGIFGMGGTGKTALVSAVAMQARSMFRFCFWRSLQDAPPFEYFLEQCIPFVSGQQQSALPRAVDDQITLLIQYLQQFRCLLVLDNFESILQEGRSSGFYRNGYEPYGRLLQRVGETRHQSCVLITSREKPKEIALLEGKESPIRTLLLKGLDVEASKQILKNKVLTGSSDCRGELIRHYAGNPLALRLVSEYIQEVFAGDIERFLQQDTIAFGDINNLLDQQFHYLSAREQEIMYWLAIEREAVSLDVLGENLAYPMGTGVLFEALHSLRRRFLIEKVEPARFSLQPIILEYVTSKFVGQVEDEFNKQEIDVWKRYAFSKAQGKEYIRASQERIILVPLAQHLLANFGREGIEQQVRTLLSKQRQTHTEQTGYLAANILDLLYICGCKLRGFDFSHFLIRQAYLQGRMLPEVNFKDAFFLESTFTNTFGSVLSVACSPTDGLMAAGTTSGDIWLYDTTTFSLRYVYQGHSDGVWGLAFSPDGSMLASSSDDGTIRLWRSSSMHCLSVMQGHTGRVRAIAFSMDGTMLASGSDDQTIRLWSVASGMNESVLSGHTGRVWSVAFHTSRMLLASGSTDQTVRIWDLKQMECRALCSAHTDAVRSVAFHPYREVIASGSDDNTICLWEYVSGGVAKVMRGHTNRVWSVAFNLDGHMIASGSEDQTIRVWDTERGESLKILVGHSQGVRSVAFMSDGRSIVSGGDDRTIRAWDREAGHCLRTVHGYTNRIWSIAFNMDGTRLISGGDDSAIRLWDVRSGQCLEVMQDMQHGVLVVAFDMKCDRFASGGRDQTVCVWDASMRLAPVVLRGHSNWVRTVAFSPDGKLLASGSEDQTIRVWDIEVECCLYELREHKSWVRVVVFSPDRSLLASGSDDRTVCIWDLAGDPRVIATLRGHTACVRTVVFSPDGNLLASGGEDQTICVWDMCTMQLLKRFEGGQGWIRSLAFSADGNLLVSGGEDQTMCMWDTSTWRCVHVVQAHEGRVRQVSFSRDGVLLGSSSDDGTVKLWDARTGIVRQVLKSEKPYDRMNITRARGLSRAQRENLMLLGAIEGQ